MLRFVDRRLNSALIVAAALSQSVVGLAQTAPTADVFSTQVQELTSHLTSTVVARFQPHGLQVDVNTIPLCATSNLVSDYSDLTISTRSGARGCDPAARDAVVAPISGESCSVFFATSLAANQDIDLKVSIAAGERADQGDDDHPVVMVCNTTQSPQNVIIRGRFYGSETATQAVIGRFNIQKSTLEAAARAEQATRQQAEQQLAQQRETALAQSEAQIEDADRTRAMQKLTTLLSEEGQANHFRLSTINLSGLNASTIPVCQTSFPVNSAGLQMSARAGDHACSAAQAAQMLAPVQNGQCAMFAAVQVLHGENEAGDIDMRIALGDAQLPEYATFSLEQNPTPAQFMAVDYYGDSGEGGVVGPTVMACNTSGAPQAVRLEGQLASGNSRIAYIVRYDFAAGTDGGAVTQAVRTRRDATLVGRTLNQAAEAIVENARRAGADVSNVRVGSLPWCVVSIPAAVPAEGEELVLSGQGYRRMTAAARSGVHGCSAAQVQALTAAVPAGHSAVLVMMPSNPRIDADMRIVMPNSAPGVDEDASPLAYVEIVNPDANRPTGAISIEGRYIARSANAPAINGYIMRIEYRNPPAGGSR